MRPNTFLRDMNLGVDAADQRRIEVLAQGLPCRGGAQLAVDVTLRSVLTAGGEARPRAAEEDGVVCEGARRDKEDAYPARRCSLVVVALETGGRWSTEAATFVEELAYARAPEAPPKLRGAAALAWQRRWVRILATACANSFAHSLVAPASACATDPADGPAPLLSQVLCDDRAGVPVPGRLPLRS